MIGYYSYQFPSIGKEYNIQSRVLGLDDRPPQTVTSSTTDILINFFYVPRTFDAKFHVNDIDNPGRDLSGVLITSTDGASATTNDEGYGVVSVTESGSITFSLNKEGYGSKSVTYSVRSDITNNILLKSIPGFNFGILSGNIYTSATGEAIPGAEITVKSSSETYVAYSDNSGDYTISLEANNYEVSVKADGFVGAMDLVTITANDVTTSDFDISQISPPNPNPSEDSDYTTMGIFLSMIGIGIIIVAFAIQSMSPRMKMILISTGSVLIIIGIIMFGKII